MVRLEETILARGHANILATHKSTFELTREFNLTRDGDCIIAVGAEKGAWDLSSRLKELLSRENSTIELTIEAGGFREVIRGRGHPRLIFQNRECMVFRKSTYIDGRTVMIQADKAAVDIKRDLVKLLQHEATRVEVRIKVSV